MNNQDNNGRRKFIKTTGAVAGVTIIPSRSVWGACNASGVSGGSQALENVCRVSSQDDPENNVSLGGFPASDFNTLFTSLNNNQTPIPDRNARGVVGAMFTKNLWLDHSVATNYPFIFPVFRYIGNKSIKNLISASGKAFDSDKKAALKALQGAQGNDISNVDTTLIRSLLDSSTEWHFNELNAVKEKLESYASETLTYVAGVDNSGKAIVATINVLDTLKNGSGAALHVAALYLNLTAGFCTGVPLGYTIKQYCEHLLSVMLENATYPGFATDLVAKISGRFAAPSPIDAVSFLTRI
ncbi:MAG: hypothetical protein VX894_09195 [Pseudomonadota bacterium]|nr:hypothetical protein [Pseudomonadota bacterium]